MHRTSLAAAALAGALVLACSVAGAGVLIPVPPVAGSIETYIRGVNDSYLIVGSYTTPDYREHGFVGTLDGTYTYFDFGKTGDTIPQAISNDGYVTGWWQKDRTIGNYVQFVRDPDGTMHRITIGGRRLKGDGSPGAILSGGAFVGWYEAERKTGNYGKAKGYWGIGTDYSVQIVLPFRKTDGTYAIGLNTNGDIAGFFTLCDVCHGDGFLVKDGVASDIRYPDPNVYGTELTAINDRGMVLGWYTDNGGDGPFSFLYNPRKQRFKRLSVRAVSINNVGVMAVNQYDGPYLYCLSKTNCPVSGNAIDVPDKWIPARADSVRSAVCTRRCRIPLRKAAAAKGR